jgi:hypothetical protein
MFKIKIATSFYKRYRLLYSNRALFLEQVKRTEIREPRGSTPVITEVVEISEVKRCDKNTALAFLAQCTLRYSKGGNEKRLKSPLKWNLYSFP